MDIRCKGCGGPIQQVNKPPGKFGAWVANECVSGCTDPSGRYPLHTSLSKAPYTGQAPMQQYLRQGTPVQNPENFQNPFPVQAPVQSTPPLTPEATLILRNISAKLDTLIKLLSDPLEKEHRKQQDLKRFEKKEELDLPDHPLPKEPF